MRIGNGDGNSSPRAGTWLRTRPPRIRITSTAWRTHGNKATFSRFPSLAKDRVGKFTRAARFRRWNENRCGAATRGARPLATTASGQLGRCAPAGVGRSLPVSVNMSPDRPVPFAVTPTGRVSMLGAARITLARLQAGTGTHANRVNRAFRTTGRATAKSRLSPASRKLQHTESN